MSADVGADGRAMAALQERMALAEERLARVKDFMDATLELNDILRETAADVESRLGAGYDLAVMIEEDVAALQERCNRQDVEIAKLTSRADALAGRVLILENPEPALDRAARGLAEFQDKIDAATPGKVPAYESDKLKARDGFDVK